MEIELIPYHQINFRKYDDCIEQSQYPIIYALSWYLDIVTNKNWKILIYGDYDAVLPIPYLRLKRNLYLKSICQPMFCQQLGVFGTDINEGVYKQMFQCLKKEKITVYQFNSDASQYLKDLPLRNNYELSLRPTYETILEGYHKTRRKDIRRGAKKGWRVEELNNAESYINKLLQHSDYLNKTSTQLMRNLFQVLQEKDVLKGSKVLNAEGEWMAMAYWMVSLDRAILLTSVRHSENDEKGAFTFLVNDFIQNQSNRDLLFDFEGSMISGIASFNSSFGAINNPFPVLKA